MEKTATNVQSDIAQSTRTRIKKAPKKASLDRANLYQIIDQSKVAHIAIVEQHGPVVIPMLAWREGNHIYIHGASNSRLMKTLKESVNTCLTFTLFDGWVLARSAFHHSAHYRSAVVFGQFTVITDPKKKSSLLDNFIEQIAPGRSKQVRPGNEKELKITELLTMPLDEASVKISAGEVNDDKADLDRPVWAGYIPYHTQVGPLKTATGVLNSIAVPDYSSAYSDFKVK